jgi:hypothetical protein
MSGSAGIHSVASCLANIGRLARSMPLRMSAPYAVNGTPPPVRNASSTCGSVCAMLITSGARPTRQARFSGSHSTCSAPGGSR